MLIPAHTSTRADIHLTVDVDANSVMNAVRFGGRTELTVSCPQGHTVVTLNLPDDELMRLFAAATEASRRAAK